MTIKLPLSRLTIYNHNVVYSSDVAEAAYAALEAERDALKGDMVAKVTKAVSGILESCILTLGVAKVAEMIMQLSRDQELLQRTANDINTGWVAEE
jgi:hypothetical protein